MSKIAIIGAGNVGRALAGRVVGAGYDVIIAATRHESAAAAAREAGARAARTVGQAMDAAEVIILAVPGTALEAVASELRGHVPGKIVIDAVVPDYYARFPKP